MINIEEETSIEDISISETPKEIERIKEIDIDLYLNEEGVIKYSTEKINGYLKQYIFKKDDITPIKIVMRLSRFPELVLFEKSMDALTMSFSPENQTQDEKGVNLTYGTLSPVVNDSIIIEIVGRPEQHVKVVLRYE